MLRFDSIRVHNVGPFADVDVDLAALPRIVAVTGANGAGKSTLLELLAGALFRECPTRGPLSGLARGRDAFVEVGCTNGVPRTLRQTLDVVSGKSEALVLDEGRQPVLADTKVRSFDAWAASHLPSPEVLYASTFGVQGSAGFLELKAGERKAVLLRVLGIERLERMAERARERRREALSTVDRLTAALAEVRGGSVEDATAALAAAVAGLASAELRVTATAQAVERVREEVARIEALARAAAEVHMRASELRATIAKARADLDGLELRATNNRGLLEQADAVREAVARWRALGDEIAAAKEAEASARAAFATAGDAVTQFHANERTDRDRLGAVKRRQMEIRERLGAKAAVEAAVAALPELRDRTATMETIVDASAARVGKALDAERSGTANRVQKLRVTLGEIASWMEDCHEHDVDMGHEPRDFDDTTVEEMQACAAAGLTADDRAVSAIEGAPAATASARDAERDARAALLTVQRALAEAERAASTAPAIAAAEREASLVDEEVAVLETRLVELDALARDATAKHGAAKGPLAAAKLRVDELHVERTGLAAAEKNAERLLAAETRLSELEPQILAARRTIASAEGELADLPAPSPVPPRPDLALAERAHRDAVDLRARADAALGVAERRSEEAAASEERRSELDAERAAAQTELADWTRLSTDLGRDGLQALEIDAAGPELSALANDLLHTCVGPRWTITVDTQRMGADGRLLESLDVRVLDTEVGREANVETFSGGERVLLGEAVSLALSMLACRASGMQGSTLIRDETGAALDAEKGPAYVGMLRRAADIVGARQVLIVSHDEAVSSLCDARLHIENGTVTVR